MRTPFTYTILSVAHCKPRVTDLLIPKSAEVAFPSLHPSFLSVISRTVLCTWATLGTTIASPKQVGTLWLHVSECEEQHEEPTAPAQLLREGWCHWRGQPHLVPGGTPSPCASWLPPSGGKMFLYGAKTASWGEQYCLLGESPVPEEAAVYQFCPHHSTQSVCAVRGIDGVGKAPKAI